MHCCLLFGITTSCVTYCRLCNISYPPIHFLSFSSSGLRSSSASSTSRTLSHGRKGFIFVASLLFGSFSGSGEDDALELPGLTCAANEFRGVIGDANIGDVDGVTRCGMVRFMAVSTSVKNVNSVRY